MSEMNWVEKLKAEAEKTNSIVCFGIDPTETTTPTVSVREFYFQILNEIRRTGIQPAAFKPNLGFFEGMSETHDWLHGLGILRAICDYYQDAGIPLILDAKRGDIGKTAERYAYGDFELKRADALTVNPYLGSDSIRPFAAYCAPEKGGKGVYILCRTSNPSANELQGLPVRDEETGLPASLYHSVANFIRSDWHVPGVGAVVGATSIHDLEIIAQELKQFGKEIPLLIPGVGAQGGSAAEVADVLRRVGYDLRICRINSSSGIAEAWRKEHADIDFIDPIFLGSIDYAGAAVREIKKLNTEIGPIQ